MLLILSLDPFSNVLPSHLRELHYPIHMPQGGKQKHKVTERTRKRVMADLPVTFGQTWQVQWSAHRFSAQHTITHVRRKVITASANSSMRLSALRWMLTRKTSSFGWVEPPWGGTAGSHQLAIDHQGNYVALSREPAGMDIQLSNAGSCQTDRLSIRHSLCPSLPSVKAENVWCMQETILDMLWFTL